MTTIPIQSGTVEEPRIGRSLWGDAAVRLCRDKIALICLGVILVYALSALLAPMLLSGWKDNVHYDQANLAPCGDYWLGTDTFGRSILQKTILAASTSMTVGFMSNIIAVPLGMLLGAIAGYYGRRLDDVIVWLFTTLTCIPSIIRLIALKFAFKDHVLFEAIAWMPSIDLDGIAGIYVALGVMSWIGTCRLVRAETMRLRELDYIQAARATGRGSFSILLRHVIPNVAHIGIIQFSLGFVGAISAEVFLSFLSLGVQDRPSWGRMINSARMDLVVGRWWEITAAVVAMFLIVLAWNLFGDRLRDALDPRLKNVG